MVTKKFSKSKPVCEVTFQLPAEIDAKKAAVVGEFNNWDPSATPLKKVKGVWKTSLELEKGHEYQYRFVVNGDQWYNDQDADKYVPNNIDGDNSVVVTYQN
jgi:1,4-alpha-glucan branching enzyme